jgi:hypothetical protein
MAYKFIGRLFYLIEYKAMTLIEQTKMLLTPHNKWVFFQ